MNNDLKISDAELHDDREKQLTLRVRIQNPGDRTLHAYASVRAIRYDPATRTLEVQLSDRGLREMRPEGTFIQPQFTSVDPNSETTIELPLPRTIARVKPGQNQVAPEVEELPVHEAENVEIEIAYSGTPFYRDPRRKEKKSPRQMMVDWAEGHATFRQALRRPKPGA